MKEPEKRGPLVNSHGRAPDGLHAKDVRIDQWLWAARLFKTRTLANRACRGGRVQIAGKTVKPAHAVQPGEVVCIKQPPVVRQYLVKKLAVKRVSAVLARELFVEITPAADLEKLALARRDPLGLIFAHREKGSGRPTKKERRHLERLIDQTPGKHKTDNP